MNYIEKKELGCHSSGQMVWGYTLTNENGMSVTISDLGGAIWQLIVPDRNGIFKDVVLSYASVADLETCDGYLGVLVGRWANRIGKANMTIDGINYPLSANEGENLLHGGKDGFHCQFWKVDLVDQDEPALILSHLSPDGDQGFPGNLSVKVTYQLKKNNALLIRYQAVTDKTTVVNLTNHAYFNLAGYDAGSVLSHELMLDASDYLAADDELIPTGEMVSVAGTPFDFRKPKTVGEDMQLDGSNPDLMKGNGYDHCLNFTGGEPEDHLPVFRGYLKDGKSGRRMNFYTNQPSVQFYSANSLKDKGKALKGGVIPQPRIALCLETQRMPDSMHHNGFSNPYLAPGEVYDYTTIYEFVAE